MCCDCMLPYHSLRKHRAPLRKKQIRTKGSACHLVTSRDHILIITPSPPHITFSPLHHHTFISPLSHPHLSLSHPHLPLSHPHLSPSPPHYHILTSHPHLPTITSSLDPHYHVLTFPLSLPHLPTITPSPSHCHSVTDAMGLKALETAMDLLNRNEFHKALGFLKPQ